MTDNEKYMSVEEAMLYLGGISRTALWKMTKKGMKRYKFGKRVLFKKKDIEEFMKDYVVKESFKKEKGGEK